MVGSSEAIVSVLGSKALAVLVNAFRSGIASFAVLSIGDVGNIFMGRISGQQLLEVS